jgi:hypothetical protein
MPPAESSIASLTGNEPRSPQAFLDRSKNLTLMSRLSTGALASRLRGAGGTPVDNLRAEVIPHKKPDPPIVPPDDASPRY